MRRGPRLELLELLLRGPDLDTRFNAIGREGACAFEVPFVKYSLLDLGVAAGKVVECLGAGFGAVDREGEIVVLEVESDAREVNNRLDADGAELLGVSFRR
jgi:hypothetical protein